MQSSGHHAKSPNLVSKHLQFDIPHCCQIAKCCHGSCCVLPRRKLLKISHMCCCVNTVPLLIHNPMRLGIMYNSLVDGAAFGSILWTWMMSTCLVIACLTFGCVPRPRSTLACVYRFEGASIFVSYSSFPHSHGCLGDRRLLASYLSQLRLIR